MAAVGLRQPEIFTSCCLGSMHGDAFDSLCLHDLFLRHTTSSGQGGEARIDTRGGVSDADQCVHGHSLREHASVFGDLWWPGDALQLRPARGVGARSLCKRICPSEVNRIFRRWCLRVFHAGNCGHHSGSVED